VNKNIIVLGGGYAGVLAAKKLGKKLGRNHKIFLIDKNKFQTLRTEIHEVAADRIGVHSVKIYFDTIFAHSNVEVIQDKITKFDFENKRLYGSSQKDNVAEFDGVTITSGSRNLYDYDYLVISSGSRPNHFGIPGAEKFTMAL